MVRGRRLSFGGIRTALHVWFLVVEMLLWQKPLGMRTLRADTRTCQGDRVAGLQPGSVQRIPFRGTGCWSHCAPTDRVPLDEVPRCKWDTSSEPDDGAEQGGRNRRPADQGHGGSRQRSLRASAADGPILPDGKWREDRHDADQPHDRDEHRLVSRRTGTREGVRIAP